MPYKDLAAKKANSAKYRLEHREGNRADCAKYRQTHLEEIAKRRQSEEGKAYQAKYRQEHREEHNAYDAKYRQQHKEEHNAYNAQYYQEHREEINARQAEYRQAHREGLAQYQLEHKEERKATRRAWGQANPLKLRESNARREALKKGASSGPVDLAAIIERDKGICGLCGKRIKKGEKLHFDHIIPLSVGGTHAEYNLQVTHAKCNQIKNNTGKLPSQTRLAI